jgi:hypothetical protein
VRIYNRYILSLTLLFLVTTVIISASNRSLDFYFSIYLIECLVLTLLFAQINPKARKGLNNIGYVLFSCFLVLVGMKVVEIITGTKIL